MKSAPRFLCDAMLARLAPRMGEELSACPACGRVYWHGSHYKRMRERLASWQAIAGKPGL